MSGADDLETLALAVDGAQDEANAEGAPGAQEEPPKADQTGAIAASLDMAVSMLAPLFPSLKSIYTPEKIGQLAEKGNALAEKHGFVVAEFFGKWKEEIEFAAVAIPVGMATYAGVIADIEAREKAAKEASESGEREPQAGGVDAEAA